MNYNELVELAEKHLSERKYEDAAEIFNKVAHETGNLYCVRRAIDLYIMLANADIAMAGAGIGVQAVEIALEDIDIAYKWLQVCMNDPNVMNEIGDYVNRQYTECLYIAGQAKFAQEEENCIDILSAAVDRGCNPARMYIGLWYDRIVSDLLKADDPDIEILHDISARAVDAFESFLLNYNPGDAKSDEFETAHMLVSFYYEVGLGVAEDKNKALEHKRNAGKLNQ